VLKNVFRRDGDMWQIVYEGHPLGSIQPMLGISYIHRLMKHEEEVISCADLEEELGKNTTDRDAEQVRELKEARKR